MVSYSAVIAHARSIRRSQLAMAGIDDDCDVSMLDRDGQAPRNSLTSCFVAWSTRSPPFFLCHGSSDPELLIELTCWDRLQCFHVKTSCSRLCHG